MGLTLVSADEIPEFAQCSRKPFVVPLYATVVDEIISKPLLISFSRKLPKHPKNFMLLSMDGELNLALGLLASTLFLTLGQTLSSLPEDA